MAWEQEFVTDREAAVLLGVCLRTVRNWRARGTGPPFYRIGATVRYTRESIMKWAEDERKNLTKKEWRD